MRAVVQLSLINMDQQALAIKIGYISNYRYLSNADRYKVHARIKWVNIIVGKGGSTKPKSSSSYTE